MLVEWRHRRNAGRTLKVSLSTCWRLTISQGRQLLNSPLRWEPTCERAWHDFRPPSASDGVGLRGGESIRGCRLATSAKRCGVSRPVRLSTIASSARQAAQPGAACLAAIRCLTIPRMLFFTDPPYYDAVPYAFLSDFFYVWLGAASAVHLDLSTRGTLPKTRRSFVHR